MNPRVLFIITGDPRTSPRPAEAVRIAAGVGVWKKIEAALYLRENAILSLGEQSEGLMDQDNFTRYWPVLAESGQPVYVQKNAASLKELEATAVPFVEISDEQLAKLAAEQTYVIRF
jgi:hypothetical protein